MKLNVVFLYTNASRYIGIPLGVASLCSVVNERGHTCDIFDATFMDDTFLGQAFIQYLEGHDCDVLLVHCTSADWWLVKILLDRLHRELSARRPITIVGGQHPTILPEKVLKEPGIDIVVLGEGEVVLGEILDYLQQGKDLTHIKNCWVKIRGQIVQNPLRRLVSDLDNLPYPQWGLFDEKHRTQYTDDGKLTGVRPIFIETSRGCPYRCSFCMNAYYRELYSGLGSYCRAKSARRIVSEAKLARDTLGINYIQFVDDNFLIYEDRLKELSIIFPMEVGLPFSVQASADKIDKNSVVLLKDMGIDMLAMGIETGNEQYRTKILGKKITDKQILNAITLSKEYGIGIMAYYMIGLPFETLEEIDWTIAFNKLAQPDVCLVSWFFPFPGTPLHNESDDKELLDEIDFGPDIFHGSTMRQNGLTKERFDELRMRFGNAVTVFGPLSSRDRRKV